MTGDILHVRLFPKGELVMGLQILQWNWMSAHYHRQAELLFDKSLELLDIRARRITALAKPRFTRISGGI